MSYENRPIPEGINVSKEHPLKEFSGLLVGLAFLIVGTVVLLSILASYMAPRVPFSVEQKIVDATGLEWMTGDALTPDQKIIEDYLIKLGSDLADEMDLPDAMKLTIHYNNSDMVNALASLGGHIVIHQGLLAKMPHENALAMVLAHEIAHIKQRHPIVAAGRGLTVGLALASIGGFSDSSATGLLINVLGSGSISNFSRRQETSADAEALQALERHYGHVDGAAALFRAFEQDDDNSKLAAFFSTHPAGEDRISAISGYAKRTAKGTPKPFPDFVKQALGLVSDAA